MSESSVTTTSGSAVAEYDEEMMNLMTGDEGHEGMDSEDFATPFVRVLQKGSPEVDEDDDRYVEGAKPGYFYHTGTGRLYKPGEILFIPVACQKLWIEWTPIDQGGGFVRQYAPGEKPPGASGQIRVTLDNGNEVFLTHNQIGFVVDSEGSADEAVFSCKSTMLTPSKKLNTALRGSKLNGKPLKRFANVVTLGSLRKENDQGSWYVFTFESIRAIDPTVEQERDWLVAASGLYKVYAEGGFEIKDEAMAKAGGDAPTGPTGAGGAVDADDESIPF